MKKTSKIFVALILAIVVFFSMTAIACGESGSECTSKCPTCGLCTDPDCTEHTDKCPGHEEEEDAEVVSAEVVIQPNKTSYCPGEIFDPTGLGVKATLSNGNTKNYFDTDFTDWTHKGEQLTEDITTITFTIPGTEVTFDVAITVGVPEDFLMTVDTSSLKETYLTTDTIDFSTIVVKVTTGGKTTVIEQNMWSLWEADTEIENITAVTLPEGEHTMTVKYLTDFSYDFTVVVNDPSAVINPAFVEAEDCAFTYDDDGNETNEKYDKIESKSIAEYYIDDQRYSNGNQAIENGSSGKGALHSLGQNGKKVYFKFDVNVPANGNYLIFARAQSANLSSYSIKDKFKTNINGKQASDGSLEYIKCESTDTVKAGNQLKGYTSTVGDKYFTNNFNMYSWTLVCIGSYELEEGTNTIRIRMPSGFDCNLDYFEIREEGYVYETQLFSMRTGSRVDLAKNMVYIDKGEKITDLINTPQYHAAKYTLIYIRLEDGREMPVTEEMLSPIDYNLIGEQEVTVQFKDSTSKFTLIIEDKEV